MSAIRTTLPRLVVVAFVYWLAARASLSLALVHGQVTPIWPPTGIALVAVLIFGRSTAIGTGRWSRLGSRYAAHRVMLVLTVMASRASLMNRGWLMS